MISSQKLNLDNDITKKNKKSVDIPKNRVAESFMIAPTTPEIIGALDDAKSSRSCSIPTKLPKMISVTFSEICNLSFEEGVFPEKNKSAKVIPSHKKGSVKDVNNYQPISLLSTFSKIMEKLMATRLNKFLELRSIIIS